MAFRGAITVDRTNTRFGKARPYEFAIVVLWVTIYAMYAQKRRACPKRLPRVYCDL